MFLLQQMLPAGKKFIKHLHNNMFLFENIFFMCGPLYICIHNIWVM